MRNVRIHIVADPTVDTCNERDFILACPAKLEGVHAHLADVVALIGGEVADASLATSFLRLDVGRACLV
eukprot:1607546-Pyramimonas_sp.AAC.1